MKINTAPQINAAAFTLIASAFLVLVYNTAFWRTFFDATGHVSLANFPLHVGSFLLIVLLFNAVLTLINFRYLLKPVLIALLMVTAATSYFMNHYGTHRLSISRRVTGTSTWAAS